MHKPATIREMVNAHLEGLLWAFAASGMTYSEFEHLLHKRLIEDALSKNNYIKYRAAKQLQIRRDHLDRRIKKFGIAMPGRPTPKRKRRANAA